jgi:hypothetical protein
VATLRVLVYAVVGALLFLALTAATYRYASPRQPHPSIDVALIVFGGAGATAGAIAEATQAIVNALSRKPD